MKNTEKQILEKAKKVLKDLKGEHYNEKDIAKVIFHENDEVARPQGTTLNSWTISIDAIFDNRDFLIISDETSEPLYYQNFNMIIAEIEKDTEGKYVIKK